MKIQIKNLNLNGMYHYYVIAKHRSLRAAAAELGLSAPAVTHSLTQLESSLNEVLCIRSRSEFSLTPSGLKLFQTAEKIFEQLENFTNQTDNETDFSGSLNIGILDHFEEKDLFSVLEKVSQRFPQIKLNIQAFDSETINNLLISNEIDVGLAIFTTQSPRLKYLKFGEEKMQYFISDKHPLWSKKNISLDQLSNYKVAWIDNKSRTKSDLETNIFIQNPKYKMQVFGFSNNLSGGLALLLSGHTVVPFPENYGNFISKIYPVKKISVVGLRSRSLSQLFAFNPQRTKSAPSKFLIHCLSDLQKGKMS